MSLKLSTNYAEETKAWNDGAYEGMQMQSKFEQKIIGGENNCFSLEGHEYENDFFKSTIENIREHILFQNEITICI